MHSICDRNSVTIIILNILLANRSFNNEKNIFFNLPLLISSLILISLYGSELSFAVSLKNFYNISCKVFYLHYCFKHFCSFLSFFYWNFVRKMLGHFQLSTFLIFSLSCFFLPAVLFLIAFLVSVLPINIFSSSEGVSSALSVCQ